MAVVRQQPDQLRQHPMPGGRRPDLVRIVDDEADVDRRQRAQCGHDVVDGVRSADGTQ